MKKNEEIKICDMRSVSKENSGNFEDDLWKERVIIDSIRTTRRMHRWL